ncbi:MAG TPA: hypothetical protein VGP95_15280 [Gemmatimonadaceae bacterium]|jgi:hypothetical protein|nr:hypothetical protein [Gemmatimonadaceae bacterium]
MRMNWGVVLMWFGALLGGAIALVGLFIPGGGLSFYLHAPTCVVGLPLSASLIASGAVLRRMEHSEHRRTVSL